jgi:hypothetical protein
LESEKGRGWRERRREKKEGEREGRTIVRVSWYTMEGEVR